jgi:hypothetical protein
MRALLITILFSIPVLAQEDLPTFSQDLQFAKGMAAAVKKAEQTGETVVVTFPDKAVLRADGTTAVPAVAYEAHNKTENKIKLFSGTTISIFAFHVEKENVGDGEGNTVFGMGPTIGVLMLNNRIEPYTGYYFGKGKGNRGRFGGRLNLYRPNIMGSSVDDPSGGIYVFGESSPGTANPGQPDVRFSTGFGFHAFSDEEDGVANGFRLELGRTFFKPRPGTNSSSGYRFLFGWVVQMN